PVEAAAPAASPSHPESGGVEIELKLLVDAERLSDFNDAPVIAAHARNKGARKHLKSTYYDTPERTLWRNGLTLRVRQNGARFVQTVKTEFRDDPLRRGEWEASVPSLSPDLALAMPFIPAKLRAELESAGLEAVFTAEIRRHQRMLDLPSGTVEVAFDKGVLKAGARSLPVSEIELELKSGNASAIHELALRLAEHGPVRPSIRSKSARGFDLAADKAPAARRPRKLRLEPSIALDDAFAAILRSCLQHLLESLPAAEDGRDPDGIHQLRVSLRRLRSALDLMGAAGPLSRLDALRADARWFAQNLSSAREWDIFQTQTLPSIAKGCPGVAGFEALEEIAQKRRAAAYGMTRLVLADPRCASFIIGLGGWIEARGWRSDVAPENLGQLAEPAARFAHRLLSEQHARVLKRGKHFKSQRAEERHRLRLAVKKLRYVVEFLLPLYALGKPARRYLQRLAGLQDELGCYNDMATTATLLAGLDEEPREDASARAAIAGWQAHAMVGSEERLRRAWSEFAKTRTPWAKQEAA
ncbi:MAG: CHAD domain-containing protein, partial [Bradyrhizobium sp.]|nr:CHAD domain-containing protein [Bradyrhizobium sp.]